jgi:hypothetical protein
MYKVIGSDQKTYGPVSAAQLRQWMAEGRVSLATSAQAEGASEWKPLSDFPEFAMPPLTLPPRTARDDGSGMAAAGLTFGILSNVCCCMGLLFGALGVVFSAVALNQSSAHPQQRGRGMATAGLVLSIVGLVWHSIVPSLFGLWSGWGLLHRHPWRYF